MEGKKEMMAGNNSCKMRRKTTVVFGAIQEMIKSKETSSA